jgi:hypothetical protein
MSASIIRECRVPHHGECDAVLSAASVVATLRAHGFEVREVHPGEVEAWEPATIIPLNGGPVRDASAWITVPHGVHALAAWLGY